MFEIVIRYNICKQFEKKLNTKGCYPDAVHFLKEMQKLFGLKGSIYA